MPSVKGGFVVLLVILASACGGSSTPTSSSPTSTPTVATTFSLNGQITDNTTNAAVIVGATVSITDGANAGKSTTTDASGRYSFTGLQSSGFTVNVAASGYVSSSKGVTLTSNQTVSFALARLTTAPTPSPSPAPIPTPSPSPVPSPTPTPSAACGVERWAVKTLADADSTRVNFNSVISTTITSLNGFAAHCSGLPDNRSFPEEFSVYEATGVVQFTRNEDDHDVHIAMADPSDPTQTIVVEVVDPACATTSPYLSTLSQARATYESLGPLTGRTVRVRGVGFYDFAHGQTGRSLSCLELHPVIAISVVSSPLPTPAPTPTPSPTPTPTRTRIGATCKDGTSSTATGSGACSSHGGVLCWKYSDGTCTNP